MAYAAINSLMSIIFRSVKSTGLNLQKYYKKLESMRAIVEKPLKVIGDDLEVLTSLEAKIAALAYRTGDIVGSESRKVLAAKSPISRRIAIWKLHFKMKRAVGRIDSTVKQWIGMLNNEHLEAQNLTLASTSDSALEPENKMVGLENEFEMIQDQLASHISESEIKRGMAYAAITCLMSTVHESMQVTGCNLQSFYEKLESSRTIMEKPRKTTADPREELTSLEAEIIEVACNTEDMVDSESRKILFAETADERINAFWELFFILEQAAECVDSTMKQWMAIWDRYNNTRDQEIQNFSLVDISQHALEMENMMVGHENEFEIIQDQIARGARELEVVSIVGMGGIGKTTLANRIYCDPFIVSRFDIRAKATLSQEHCVRNVLLRLLSSTRGKTDECYEEQDDGQLADRLQKLLKGKRYLVVIDDIWTTEAWDDIKLCFPDCNNGGRILLTTRNVEVAEYASSGKPPYHMRLMNFDESWNLLHKKVFEKEYFSPEFEKIGKRIASKCGGLPLAIAVIAGLLSKMGKALDEWQSVAENVSSVVSTNIDVQCMTVLALSYHHLPHHLKPCFLYFAIFPEDELIFVDKLMELWASEGFLKVGEMKSIEEVAKKCLKELIDRSLICIHNLSFDGEIESCWMHDVIRELCLREARNMNFVNVLRAKNGQTPRLQSTHFSSISRVRISVHLARYPDIEVRSIICFSGNWFSELLHFKLVRVLDLTLMRCDRFPSEILDLIHLRYLALTLSPSLCHMQTLIDIPPQICSLCHLETFILSGDWRRGWLYPLILPSEILVMPQLRLLRLDWNYFVYLEPTEKSLVLKNLQYLYGWNPWYCNGSLLFPNLKKLQIRGIGEDFSSCKELYDFRCLDQLEELEFCLAYRNVDAACFLETVTPSGATSQDLLRRLKFSMESTSLPLLPTDDALPHLLLPPPDAFPQRLKKLAFSGTCLQWMDLSIVGKLPKLEVLKLENDACIGDEWEVVDEGFPYLKLLLLERLKIRYWRASCDHFPCLERLFLERCLGLDSIPQDFTDITTLALINVSSCAESVGNSAKQIQQDIQDNYGTSVEVTIVRHVKAKNIYFS
ncbi:putative late blight resistance protein homolog R1A-3 [Nicotiana tabacum]|uniref:Late blight resistance protein homolog R1A-3 n=1 Tax=Nicotiana tabacum TaxID=4097 RepID=A0A1S4DI67_TOBAC|nr:PREDICTED: putative late blight resistance protein homolog R1B-14 [Nicotiana tabacum]